MKKYLIFLGFCVSFIACNNKKAPESIPPPQKNTGNSYAKLFSIEQLAAYKQVTVHNPWNESTPLAQYALVPKGIQKMPSIPNGVIIVKTPVERIVTQSMPQLGFLKSLKAYKSIIGHGNFEQVFDPEIQSHFGKPEVVETGLGSGLDTELILNINPGALLVTSYAQTEKKHTLIQKAGIPVIYNVEWMETHPLGRAEWIKFMGALTGKDELADSVFKEIEHSYNKLKSTCISIEEKPTLLIGSLFKGTWHMPGGQSYAAQFIKDAGGTYYWSETKRSGSLALSLEEVMDKALHAPIWINPGTVQKLTGLLNKNAPYALFDAVKNKQVYANTNRLGANGASDYWETGVSRPDLVLKDLVKILHPELLPGHQLYYYQKLP